MIDLGGDRATMGMRTSTFNLRDMYRTKRSSMHQSCLQALLPPSSLEKVFLRVCEDR